MGWADPLAPAPQAFQAQSDEPLESPGCALCRAAQSPWQIDPHSPARVDRQAAVPEDDLPDSSLAPEQDFRSRVDRARLPNLPFRDRQPLINRLKSIQALPFVTLWDSGEAAVYIGVNHRGQPGLHLQQKLSDSVTAAFPPDEATQPGSPAQAKPLPAAVPSVAKAPRSK